MTVTISSSPIILIKHFIALVSKTRASKSSHSLILSQVFDDMCGKYSIHVQTMNDWKVLSDCIKKIIDGKHIKILLSCRSYIFYLKHFKSSLMTDTGLVKNVLISPVLCLP
jgi:hypothetical protein